LGICNEINTGRPTDVTDEAEFNVS